MLVALAGLSLQTLSPLKLAGVETSVVLLALAGLPGACPVYMQFSGEQRFGQSVKNLGLFLWLPPSQDFPCLYPAAVVPQTLSTYSSEE